jgi:hypothetical protein
MKKNTLLLALAGLVLIGLLYIALRKPSPISKDIERDHARFTPAESVDVAMAMRLVTHEPPQILAPPTAVPPLLLFPPSADDLAKLSGQ